MPYTTDDLKYLGFDKLGEHDGAPSLDYCGVRIAYAPDEVAPCLNSIVAYCNQCGKPYCRDHEAIDGCCIECVGR